MRVGCFGNMNNNMFALVRYLRDRGYDAELVLLGNEIGHFGPAADTYDLSYQDYTRRVPWGDWKTFHSTPPRQLQHELTAYDFLVGTGPVPAFCHRAGRPLDLCVPYGGDLYELPFFEWTGFRRSLDRWRFASQQGHGIRQAGHLLFDYTNPDFERTLGRLGYPAAQRICTMPPFLYLPVYAPENLAAHYCQTHWAAEFQRLRTAYDLVLFHHSRHEWQQPECFAYKANDVLFRGFAQFRRERPDVRACIITIEYGSDVAASRSLVQSLGIDNVVFWFPAMQRKDLMVGLHLCDIGTGEFGRSWLTFGCLAEALAMGKPILHYRDDALYRERVGRLYPILYARTPTDISRRLTEYVDDPDRGRDIGSQARKWLLERFADSLRQITALLVPSCRPGAAPAARDSRP